MRGGTVLFVGCGGPSLSAAERRIVRRVAPAGVVLLPRNIVDAEQLLLLVAELRSLLPGLLLALDAEGGRVDRLRDLVGPAPAAHALAGRAASAAGRAGRWIGEALRHFGFDLDFAPVVDLDRGQADNALERRSFGSSPRVVVSRAKSFLRGLRAAGVGGCLKHFPGLGGAGADTHFEPSQIGLAAAELELDLAPFRALAREAGALMVGHAIYPTLDPQRRPASLSPPIATGLLRTELGFRGVALSDDLEMGALAPTGDLSERGEAALVAGCDGLLFCRELDAAPDIAERLGRPRLELRLRQAENRLVCWRRQLRAVRRAAGVPPSLATIRARLAALDRPAVAR